MALVIRDLLGLVAAVQSALSANLEPSGPNDHETLCTLLGLMDSAEQRAAEAQARQDKTDAKLWRDAASLLPGTAYMDPPDGGSVTIFEQLQRMAADAELWRFLLRTVPDNTPENAVMRLLAENIDTDKVFANGDAYAAYIADGLRQFKAGAQ